MSDGRPERPEPLAFEPGAVPDELRDRDQWVCWQYEWDSDCDEWTKVPIKPYDDRSGTRENIDPDHEDHGDPEKSHNYAGSTWVHTWRPFGDAVAYHHGDPDTDGPGFVVTGDDLFVALDLDDCRDPDTGELDAWAADVVDAVPTYWEVSPSGTGLRGFALGILPDGGTRAEIDGADGHIEIYGDKRYLTVTGNALDDAAASVEQVNDAIDAVHGEYIRDDDEPTTDGGVAADSPDATPRVDAPNMPAQNGGSGLDDDTVIEKAKNADNGDKFARLWNGNTAGYESHSEARQAFANLLAFWTGCDESQMLRLFESSGLYRGEDDERTWTNYEAPNAIKSTSETYEPGEQPPDPSDHGSAERVDDDLADALLSNPENWIDTDGNVWTVRGTGDHDAETIADALEAGELPGDADAAIADAVLSGNVPDAVGKALQSWRQDPDAWSVEVVRSFDDDELTPEAIAGELAVPVSELRDEPNGRIAYTVWERVRHRDDIHVVSRSGERADGAMFAYDHDAGVWRQTGDDELRTVGRTALAQAYTTGVGRELEEQVRTTRAAGEPAGQVHIDDFGAPEGAVPVANGLIDLDTRERRPLAPEDYALSALPVDHDPDADCPTFREYLRDVCPRSVDRDKLQEYVGYTLMHWGLPYHKALFLAGPQASGKSTFLDVVNALLGDDTTCSLAPQEMTEERFAGYDLWGAWANIRSDIPSDLIQNTGKFKELLAGDPVKVEKKYQDPITIRPHAKHLFAANTLPSADIDDDAFFRRILMVSFPKTIPREDRDPHLFDELEAELPGVLNWALEGLDRLREQGHFSGDLPPAETQAKWRSWGESIERFKERCLDDDAAATAVAPKRDVFDAYRTFCESEGIPAESKHKFGREMMSDSGVGERQKTIDGKRVWCYTGVDLLTDRIPDGDGSDDGGDQHGFGGFDA